MLDWDDLRFFLAIAREGTLSAAARVLGVTQPTVGRRITAFEAHLGAQLFERAATGWTLSEVGRELLVHAERMQEQALYAESLASGRSGGMTGSVRITASEWMIRSVLGAQLAPLLTRHPALVIELLADARHLSLVRREADLALRPSPFTHPDVVQREVGALTFGLYASDSYLARHGMPDFARGAEGHVFIGMTEGLANLADYEWLPPLIAGARLAVRTNGREPMATMAASGLGFTCLPCFLGDATAGLRRLPTPLPSPRRKLWLGAHRAAHRTPRVRETLRFLAERLRGLSAALAP